MSRFHLLDLFEKAHTIQTLPLWLLLPAVFVIGILGMPHCLGMCGTLCLMSCPDRRKNTIYQIGRLAAYSILGGLFMVLGRNLYLHSFQHVMWFGFVAAMMVLFVFVIRKFGIFANLRIANWMRDKPKAWYPFISGFSSGLLPCGMLHLVLGIAGFSGDFFMGYLILLVFWFGTLPTFYLGTYFFSKWLKRVHPNKSKVWQYGLAISCFLYIFMLYELRLSAITTQPATGAPDLICHGAN